MLRTRWFNLISLLVVFAMLLGAFQPVLAQEEPPAPEPQGLRPDAPEFARHGPYGVGYKAVVIGAETERPLEVGLWYPAMIPAGVEEAVTYSVTLKYPAEEIEQPAPIYGHALQDAEIDPAAAPYPLVIFSPGFASNGASYNVTIEHLASHGFIVLAPEHQEQWDPEWSDLAPASIDRPQDVKQTLDYAEQLNGPDGEMASMIDMENVAVAGHSYGGYTALAMAGAQYDLDAYNARCAALAPDDPNNFLCLPLVPNEAAMAARAGLDPMPEGLWPSFGDPRVKAILPIAGDSYLFDKAGMAQVTVPMLAIGGTEDTGTPYAWGSEPAYEYAGSAHKALVTFEGAEHMIASSCAGRPWIDQIIFYQWACFDPVWDKDRALDLVNHFATAFLLAELKGDPAAAAALAPENVAFPGIEYQAEGYAPTAAEAGLEAATTAKIDAIIEQAMTDFPTPGFAMCIVKDGLVIYDKGFGMADVAGNRAMTPTSVSTQASVSKPLTAIAIMQLVEAGVIDLDAPVTTYLPYFTMADPRYKEITSRMLLSHVSGLPEVPVKWETPLDPALDPLEQAVRSLSDQQLLAAPGEQWNYSGWGYSMLGDIIAKVSGEPYASYMQEHLLKPMGMANSTFDMTEVDLDLYVTGYISDEDGKAKAMQHFVDPRDVPNSGLWSNCEDLLRWSQFMLNAGEYEGVRVLLPESIDAMLTPVAGTFWPDIVGPWYGAGVKEYGLGWYVGGLAGRRLADHPGAGDGVNAHIQFAPDDGLAVIAYNNWLDYATASWYPASFAAIDVMYLLLGIEPEAETPTSQLDPDLTAQIDAMIEETMARIDLPGFALAVVKDGEVAYTKGYGVTSLDGGEPVTADTVFQWAESTMALTAMAVMQLVEAGKLDLDAPVTDYVPYFKLADERYKEITVGQLVAHTSGIPDSGDAMADWENFMPEYDGGALERWVRNDLAEKGLLFAPGEGWEYSDLGYALLGAVIGAASGQPYETYMQEHILTPLGMEKSTFLLEEVDKALLASPHVPNAAGEVTVSEAMPYHRPFAATNNLFGSVEDMAKLAQANLNHGALGEQRILSETVYDMMWTATTAPTPFADFPFGRIHPANMMTDWGNGWFLGDAAGYLAPNSYGGEHGFNAYLLLVPDADLAVVAVGNGQAMDEFYAPDLAVDVAGMLLEQSEAQ